MIRNARPLEGCEGEVRSSQSSRIRENLLRAPTPKVGKKLAKTELKSTLWFQWSCSLSLAEECEQAASASAKFSGVEKTQLP